MTFSVATNKTAGSTIIRVVGVGGSGGNAINYMLSHNIQGVEVVAINSDSAALKYCNAPTKILLGNDGKGAGDKPDVGRLLAEESREKITDALSGSDMVIITTGMGGGTGTGASPVIAEIAQKLGILTLGIVTKPFSYEGKRCLQAANEGIATIEKYVDSLVVVLNDNLSKLEGADKWTLIQGLSKADEILYNAASGISQVITQTGRINLDFNDIRTVMGEMGRCLMGYASAEGVDRARIVTEKALASPLLEGVDLNTAKSVLVNVTASDGLLQSENTQIMETIQERIGAHVNLMPGLVIDNRLDGEIRVTIIATGITAPHNPHKKMSIHVSTPMQLATGTDGAPVSQSPASNMRFSQPAGVAPSASPAPSYVSAQGQTSLNIPAFLRNQAQ